MAVFIWPRKFCRLDLPADLFYPESDMLLKTQYVVITGGHGSLGRAIAATMQSVQASVAAPSRLELDVRDKTMIHQYFKHRIVDLLVCAAGITRDVPLIRLTESNWNEVWEVNFKGVAMCVNAALPGMLKRKSGHIVLFSSFSALHPPIGQAAYATAKAALLGFMIDLTTRYGSSNIRVNVILPGFLETPMTATVTERRKMEILAAHTLGRFNTCSETAGFIRLLHYDMPHTSGQIFQLDSRVNEA
jgi:3-oxoacyl-[acyl-carrier protein] reductase